MQNAQACLKAIEAGHIQPVYVLFGTEAYLRQAVIEALKHRLVPPPWEEMNLIRFSGSDDLDAFQLARTSPFGGEKRVLILEDSQLLGGTRKGTEERNSAVREALAKYLQRPSRECCLVFNCPAERVDRRLRIVKLLLEQGLLVECNQLSTAAAVEWSVAYVQQAGKRLERLAASHIVEGSSRRLHDVKNELDKLILFVGEGDKIGLEEAKAAGSARGAVIFDLTEALMAGQSQQAIAAVGLLLQQGEVLPVIVFMLARQFRMLWGAKRDGYRSKALAGLPRFVVDRLIKCAQKTSWRHLEKTFAILVELDYTIKTGRGEPARALELAVLRLCAMAAQG